MQAFIFRYYNEVHLVYAKDRAQAWEMVEEMYDEDAVEEGTLWPLPTSDVPATFVIAT
jgi:hypothetical protein